MLIIDDSSKTIFLHNPKCGGTFLEKAYVAHNPDVARRMFFGLHGAETNTDEAHINALTLPRFVPNFKEYQIMTLVRNPYNRFVSAFNTAPYFDPLARHIWNKHGRDPQAVCEYLLSCDFQTQDNFLRNPKRPWFMPQYLFMGADVKLFRYESQEDWAYIFDRLGIRNVNVKIKPDYNIDDSTKAMLRDLYFDDRRIFEMYK